jgi:DNA-binding transcriptional LysR family regulator
MDLSQLRVFHQVAKLKSFRAAADALFVTPPAVSIRVKQMEERYGLRLFERSGRKVELTDAGEALLGYAEQVFRLVKEADDHMNDLKGGMTGSLRIGTGLTVGTYHLAPLINAFSKEFPNVDIQMNVTNKKGVVDDILSLKDDLGFVGNGPFDPNLVAARLWEDELVVITSKSLSFGSKPTILPAELSQQPLIVRERGSGTRECIEESLRRQGVVTKTFMELGSDEAIKRAVAVGLGISIVPVGVVENEVKLGVIKQYRLKAQRLHLDYFMVYHKDKYISKLIRAFMDLTLRHAAAHRGGAAAVAEKPASGATAPARARRNASGSRTQRP